MAKNLTIEQWEQLAINTTVEVEQLSLTSQKSTEAMFDSMWGRMKQLLDYTYEVGNTLGQVQKIAAPYKQYQYRVLLDFGINTLEKYEKYTEEDLIFFRNELNKSYYSIYDITYGTLRLLIIFTSIGTNNILSRDFPIFMDTAYRAVLYGIQTGTEVGVIVTPPTKEMMLEQALASTIEGLTYEDRLWKNTEDIKILIKKILDDNLTKGSSQETIEKEIYHAFIGDGINQSYFKDYIRLNRTEADNLINMGILAGSKDSKVIPFGRYVAILDGRTSKICLSLDGTVLPIDEYIRGVNAPPMHVNCRSSIAPYCENIQEQIEFLKSNGIAYTYVPPTLKYAEWELEYLQT